MSKVSTFKIDGLYLFFRSNDHIPPHFHVQKKGEWEIKVYILTCTEDQLHFDWKYPKNKSAGPTAAEQRSIRLLVVQNREKLLEEWEEKVIVKEQM